MSKQKVIIIMGMHRSGTSAVAGSLNLLGIDFGRHLMKPAFDNEKGYFENTDIYNVNEAIFQAIGSSWDSLFPLPPDWWEKKSLTIFKDRLVQILNSQFEDDKLFAIKDPRISRLFPLWKEVLDAMNIEYSFIIPVRSPWEVARSLQARNKIPLKKGTHLWMNYNLEAELYSRNYPRVILAFDDLLADTSKMLCSIADKINIENAAPISSALQKIQIFLDPQLKHYNRNSEPGDEYMPSLISEYYRELLRLSCDEKVSMNNIKLLGCAFNEICDYFCDYEFVNSTELKYRLQEKELEIDRILHSVSWRITAPFRFIKSKILGMFKRTKHNQE